MKRISKLTLLLSVMSILFSANMFAAHNHKYLKIWDSDKDFHWHPASCHDDAQGDIARHTFSEWELLKEATEEQESCKIRICSVCNYEDLVKFPKLEHTHKFEDKWSNDEFIHWKGTICGHNEVIKEPARHSYSDFVITKAATEDEDGLKTRTCSVCGYEDSVTIIKIDHVHQYADAWSKDDFIHWKAPLCKHANSIKDASRHTYSSWEILKAATSSEEGSKKRKCTVCGYEETATIGLTGHTHEPGAEWSSDEMYHFHKCKGCDKETGNKKHTFGDWITENKSTCAAKGSKYKLCSVCGYKLTEEIAIDEDAHKWGTDKCELCGKKRDSQGSVVSEKWMTKTGNIKINGKEILKTSEVVVVPKDSYAYINSEETEGVLTKGRSIRLSPYVMGQYEVTRDLYKAVMGKDPSQAKATGLIGQNPVNCVNWYEAISFCNKLSKLCGLECVYSYEIDDKDVTDPDKWLKAFGNYEDNNYLWANLITIDLTKNGYRLPTEAEWEFAARGGNPDKPDWKYAFSGINTAKNVKTEGLEVDANLKTVGWYKYNSKESTNVVGLKLKNALNIYDMTGNVCEWCSDIPDEKKAKYSTEFNSDYMYTKDGYICDPAGASSGNGRALRGGGWLYSASYCAVSYRDDYDRYDGNYDIGFRLVRSSSK